MTADKQRYDIHFHASMQGAVVDDYNKVKTIIQDCLTQPYESLHQLPFALANFIGRQAELETITLLLRHNQNTLAILTGMAGIGKSALALQAANQLKADFPDAQIYVNLRGSESQPLEPMQVLASFIRSLAGNDQLIPENLTERSNLYRSLLANQRVLIILDNALNEAQIQPLLPEKSTCSVLITTRKSFTDLEGVSLELDVMTEQEALELLQHWIGSDRLQAELEAAKNIIDLCSRLPLAICITGATLKNQPDWRLETGVSKLTEERQRLLALRLSDLAVRVSMALSYQKLDATTARLLRLLGLLTGPNFSPALATALLETTSATAEQSVKHLVAAQLLELTNAGRYRFHDLVRLFARGQLAQEEPSEARQAARLRISRWYLETSQLMDLALNPDTRQQLVQALASEQNQAQDVADHLFKAALNWYAFERTNLLASIEWAYQGKSWEIVASLATNLTNANTYAVGDWEQTQGLVLATTYALEELASHALKDEQVRHFIATKSANLGNIYSRQGEWQKASECYNKSLIIFQEQENSLEVAKMLGNLANIDAVQGNWDSAGDRYQQSLNIFNQISDRSGAGQTLANYGILYAQQNQAEKASALWQEALVKLTPDLAKSQQVTQWLNATNQVNPPANTLSQEPPVQQPMPIVGALIILVAIALFLFFLIS